MRTSSLYGKLSSSDENLIAKTSRNYLIAFVIICVIVLLGGHFFVYQTWGETALQSVFLAFIGMGSTIQDWC